MISYYKIDKLFGFRNVRIDFENNIKILIGENGYGKTTVLNSLYYLLNAKYTKLSKIEFESIEIGFYEGSNFIISKYDLDKYVKELETNRRTRLPLNVINNLHTLDFSYLDNFDEYNEEVYNYLRHSIFKNKIKRFAPTDVMSRLIYKFLKGKMSLNVFEELELVKNNLGFKLLYLPTYRRVEEDLKNLGNFKEKEFNVRINDEYYHELQEDKEINNDTLIHFGMEDVREKVIEIETEIEKLTISGFSKLTGEMLSQLLRGFPKIDNHFIEELDVSTAKIILDRVGNSLSKTDKKNISSLLENKTHLKEKPELVYFISKLIGIYNEHKHLDDSLKIFKDVCNKYLVDKEFRYDESHIDLDIFRKNNNDKVEINKLSSGEKQIISILSKVYLESSNNLIILFDEPELSLSLPWQRQLLPHLIDSNKCKFLLSVTHSPFIFENELDKYAVGINLYMEDIDEQF